MNDIILSTQNGEPVVSSREVAKNFGKEHKDVLKAINNLVGRYLRRRVGHLRIDALDVHLGHRNGGVDRALAHRQLWQL